MGIGNAKAKPQQEEYYITLYNTVENGFNLLSGGLNHIASQETKDKMSRTRKGVPKSEAHKEAIANALKGKKKNSSSNQKQSIGSTS